MNWEKYKYYYIALLITIILVVIGIIYFIIRKNMNAENNIDTNILDKKKNKGTTKNILFIGDSITVSPYSYPKIIEKNNPSLKIDVLAKGGMATKWMLQNLPAQLSTKKYDQIYIYGGVNDAWNSSIKLETTLNNLQSMVDMGNQNGADVFIILGYEPLGFMDYNKMSVTRYQKTKEDNLPLIEKYKQYQSLIPTTIKGAFLVNKFQIPNMTGDGIHPNSKEQKIMADDISKTINL
jgi:lysophospholipase L1-like esterase